MSKLLLTAKEVQTLLHRAMPSAANIKIEVLQLTGELAEIKIPFSEWMLRPGDTLSGPAIMTAADTAMYVLILGLLGPKLLAVTSNLNMNFLRKPPRGNLIAEAKPLKVGRSLIYIEVEIYIEGQTDCVAHITGSYAIPQNK